MAATCDGSGSAGRGPEASDLVLVLNTGSSSVKVALCNSAGQRHWQEQRAWSGQGGELALIRLLDDWLEPLLEQAGTTPALVVHRLVHGGERFTAPTPLNREVLRALEQLVPLAPLHNGPALAAIHWLDDRLRQRQRLIPQWACFDTGFHASLKEETYSYALPLQWREQGLRRFGFHGLNHQHIGETVARQAGGVRRLVSSHLGAGCSLCAIEIGDNGIPVSVDTTMGFTPLEGLVMATRSGTVDPGLLLHLLRGGMTVRELDEHLNRHSGLLGLSALSGDMRELRAAERSGHPGARLALRVFRHRLCQGIAAMAASLGGVDAIALSGGIGEHDHALADALRQDLSWLGALQWLVVPADEEGLMVRLCLRAAESKA